MQKAVEPENDAGFPKHNYSQLNCSCYSYPSSIDYSGFFRLHIYGISKWLLTPLTHTLMATAHLSPYKHSMCTSYVLCTYLYCVYALIGGTISIRDPYICANESHAVFHRPVAGVLNWRYDAIHGARECQRASIFFPAPL